MDSSIDITDSAFSLANIHIPDVSIPDVSIPNINIDIDTVNEVISNTTEDIIDLGDNSFVIYLVFGVIFLLGIFTYSYYSNKKTVTFQDKLDVCYGDKCYPDKYVKSDF